MKSMPIPKDTEETCYIVSVIAVIQKCRTVFILIFLHIMIMEKTNFTLFTIEEKRRKELRNVISYQKAILQLPLTPLQSNTAFLQYWKSPSKSPEIQESEGGMWLPLHSLPSWNIAC